MGGVHLHLPHPPSWPALGGGGGGARVLGGGASPPTPMAAAVFVSRTGDPVSAGRGGALPIRGCDVTGSLWSRALLEAGDAGNARTRSMCDDEAGPGQLLPHSC